MSQIKLVLIMSVVLDCQHVRAGLEYEVPWPGLQGLAFFLLSPDLKFTQLSNCLQFLCTCPAGPQLCALIKPGTSFPYSSFGKILLIPLKLISGNTSSRKPSLHSFLGLSNGLCPISWCPNNMCCFFHHCIYQVINEVLSLASASLAKV